MPFATLLRRTLERSQMSFERPDELIVYKDEVTPGRQLWAPNKRKLYAMYWSVGDFGLLTLSNEWAWFARM